MPPEEARQLAEDIRKKLTSNKQWCNVTEINEPNLKFFRIDASIKVKQ